MKCKRNFQKIQGPDPKTEQLKASKVQVKSRPETLEAPPKRVLQGCKGRQGWIRDLSSPTPSQGLGGMKLGSREATFAVRKECMKKSSSCSFGQITSSVTSSLVKGLRKWSLRVALPS